MRSAHPRRRLATSVVLAGALGLTSIAGLSAVTGGAASAATSQTGQVGSSMVTKHVITMRDGVQIDGTVISPAQGNGPWPLVIMPGTYAADTLNTVPVATALSERGFVVVTYVERGLGKSTGFIDAAGAKDVADASDVLTWALANTKADPAKVGITSVSYGSGYIPMVVAKDPRYTVGAMVSGWGDLWSSRFPNDTNALASNVGLYLIGLQHGRFGPEAADFFTNAIAGKETEQMRLYALQRSPMMYLDELRKRNVPMYMTTSMNEMIWPADQMMAFYDAYPGVKHLDILPGDHANTELQMDQGNVGFAWDGAFDWLEHHLLGRPQAVATGPQVRVAPHSAAGSDLFTSDVFKKYATESYPSTTGQGREKRWYLASAGLGNGTLATGKGTRSVTIQPGFNPVTNGIPMWQGVQELIIGKPTPVPLALANPSVTPLWRSAPLTAATSIRGTSRFHLELTPSAGTGTVFVYLVDQAPNGDATIIGHKPYSWRTAAAGKPMMVDVTIPYQAYDLPQGHRLVAAVSGRDQMYADRNPANSKTVIGPGSYVSVPVK